MQKGADAFVPLQGIGLKRNRRQVPFRGASLCVFRQRGFVIQLDREDMDFQRVAVSVDIARPIPIAAPFQHNAAIALFGERRKGRDITALIVVQWGTMI